MWQLQGFDSDTFLQQHWQKNPLVIRQAFANFTSPITPDELAGLACEEDVHCRLVVEKDGSHPWQVQYGPFDETIFSELPETHYSLLVSECEKWLPDLNELLDQFRFIPDWRIDDLMISYAPTGGSVGPHIDQYDVFLLQAEGSRRWQFNQSVIVDPDLIPGLELAILQDFKPEHEVVLEPGDMLYLPPGLAHHGVALEPGMTFSIGFRAPTALATMESLLIESDAAGLGELRYQDPMPTTGRHSAEITDAEIAQFKTLATRMIENSKHLWGDAIGKMLSDSPITPVETPALSVSIAELQTNSWIRHPETRMLYHQSDTQISLFCNGKVFRLPANEPIKGCVKQLCELREWPSELIEACLDFDSLKDLLIVLASENAIIQDSI